MPTVYGQTCCRYTSLWLICLAFNQFWTMFSPSGYAQMREVDGRRYLARVFGMTAVYVKTDHRVTLLIALHTIHTSTLQNKSPAFRSRARSRLCHSSNPATQQLHGSISHQQFRQDFWPTAAGTSLSTAAKGKINTCAPLPAARYRRTQVVSPRYVTPSCDVEWSVFFVFLPHVDWTLHWIANESIQHCSVIEAKTNIGSKDVAVGSKNRSIEQWQWVAVLISSRRTTCWYITTLDYGRFEKIQRLKKRQQQLKSTWAAERKKMVKRFGCGVTYPSPKRCGSWSSEGVE